MRPGPRIESFNGGTVRVTLAVCVVFLAANPSTQTSILNIPYGRSWPHSIVVDSSRQLVYVDGLSGLYPPGGFSFGVINSSSAVLTDVLALNGTAGKLALDEESGTVYAAGDGSIAVFDGQRKAFFRTIHLNFPIFSMAFDGSTGSLLVTSGDSVIQLDPATGKVFHTATAGSSAEGMAVDPTRGEVFVANYLSSSVSVLRVSDLTEVVTIALHARSYPSELALDQKKGILYVTTGGSSVVRVDVSSNSLMGSLPVSGSDVNGTYALAVDPARDRLFVATEPGRSVTELDASTGSLISSFLLDSAAVEMAVDQRTGTLYVTDYHQVTAITPPETTQVGQHFPSLGVQAALAGLALAACVVYVAVRLTSIGGGGMPLLYGHKQTPHRCSLHSV